MIGSNLVDQVSLFDAMHCVCWNFSTRIRVDFPKLDDSNDLDRSVILNWSYRMMQPYCNRVIVDGDSAVWYGFCKLNLKRKTKKANELIFSLTSVNKNERQKCKRVYCVMKSFKQESKEF